MKNYKQLKEDIGLSTGAGLAMYDPMLGGTRREQPKPRSIYDSLGICKECMSAMVMENGNLTCPGCKKTLKEL
jgi:hypothetical protein